MADNIDIRANRYCSEIFYNPHFDNQNYLPYTILSYVVLLFGYNKTAEQFNIYQTIIAMGVQTHRNQNKFNKNEKMFKMSNKVLIFLFFSIL